MDSINGLVHAVPPDSATDSDTEGIIKMTKIRGLSKSPDLVCAMKGTGGCSKCFDTVKELAKWVSMNYGDDWKDQMVLNAPKIPAKRKLAYVTIPSSTPAKQTPTRHHSYITVAFQHLYSDLYSQYTHEAITYYREEHLLFNIPADHQCLFHTLEGVLKSLHKGRVLTTRRF